MAKAQWKVTQADGATVFIYRLPGRSRTYRTVIEDCGTIVTGFRELSLQELKNLSSEYGFPLPW